MIRRQWLSGPEFSGAVVLVVCAAFGLVASTSRAQAPTTAVGSSSVTQSVTVTITTPGAPSSISVVTQGAPSLDYALASPNAGTCFTPTPLSVGQTCTVQYVFSPTRPFTRYGGVSVFDAVGNLLGNVFLTAVGTSSQLSYPLGASSTTAAIGAGFITPSGVAVDAQGNVYVADAGHNAVKEIKASDGSTVTLGNGFSGPTAVAIDGAGNIYVADTGNNQVKEIVAVNGTIPVSPTIRILGSGFSGPQGVAVDGSGNVYVADTTHSAVKEMLAVNGVIPTTPTINPLGSGFTSPVSVAVDPNGNVYVVDSSKTVVTEVTAGSTIVSLGSGLSSPRGVAVDGLGDVYVGDAGNNAVKELVAVSGAVPTSNPTIVTLGFGYANPLGVAVDAAGNVFVADTGNNAVEKLTDQISAGLSFATTPVGTTSSDSPKTTPVLNSGNAPLGFAIPSSGVNPSATTGFTVGSASTCPLVPFTAPVAGSLPGGASCNYSISFSPLTAATFFGQATLGISGPLPAGSNVSILLNGTGTAGTAIVTVGSASTTVDSTAVTLTASVAYGGVVPTGPFTFSVNSGAPFTATCTGSASPESCTATYDPSNLTVGSYTIQGMLNSDANYNNASGSGTLTVNMATPTVNLTTTGSPSVVDNLVTFTASISPTTGVPPTGTVSFSNTLNGVTTPISQCPPVAVSNTFTAACVTNGLMAGANSITATYSGNSNFVTASSAALVQNVTKASTSTAVTSNASTSYSVDQSVTFTAVLSSAQPFTVAPGGNVTFTANGVTIPGCAAQTVTSATANCTTSSLVFPADAIVAIYNGDANFNASTSPQITQNVAKNTPSTAVTSSPSTAVTNQTVTFTTTITPPGVSPGVTPTGSVVLTNGGVTVCGPAVLTATANGTATASCSAPFNGIFAATIITATYSGDANFNPGTPGTVSQTVVAAPSVTTANSNLAQPAVNQSVNLSATFGPTTGSGFTGTATPQSGTVTFTDPINPGTPLCSVTVTGGSPDPASCSTAFSTPGAHVITATFTSADPNFTTSSGNVTVTVAAASQTLTFSNPSPASPTVNQAVPLAASFVNPLNATATGTYVYTDSLSSTLGANCTGTVTAVTSIPACTDTVLTAGTHVILLTFTAGTGSGFASTTATLNLSVGHNTPTVIVTSPATGTTDQLLTFIATITPALTNPAATGTTPASGTVTFSRPVNSVATTICTAPVTPATGVATCPNTVPFTAVGTYSITATYSGDTSFATATSAVSPLTISQGGTSLAYVAPPSPAAPVVNQSTIYTVQFGLTNSVNDTGLTAPSGNITFADQAAPSVILCVVAAPASGTVSCSFPLLTSGVHTLVATYAADTNFTGSTVTFSSPNVQADATTTALVSDSATAVVNQIVNLSATFVPITGVGFTGTATPQSGTVTFTDSVNPGIPLCSVTITGGLPDPATCATSFTTTGSHVITAIFTSTSPNFLGSTANTVMVTVGSASQTLIFNNPPPQFQSSTSPTVNQPVTLSASFANPGSATATGTYSYADGSSGSLGASCTGTVSNATLIPACTDTVLAQGSHLISLKFTASPGSGFISTVSTITFYVASGATTVSAPSFSPASIVVGQVVALTSIVTPAVLPPSPVPGGTMSPTGNVSFSYGGVTLCTAKPLTAVAGGTATATCTTSLTNANTYNISATYSGDNNFTASTSPSATLIVGRATPIVTLTPTLNPAVASQSVTYTAVVSNVLNGADPTALPAPKALSTFTFTFSPSSYTCAPSAPTGSVQENCVVQAIPNNVSGIITVTATYPGDANYTSASATFQQTVQNFAPAVSPTQFTMSNGGAFSNTNLIDPYLGVPISLVVNPQSGFSDPVKVTSCLVLPVSPLLAPPLGTLSCAVSSATFAPGALVPVVLTAAKTATQSASLGDYTIQLTVVDAANLGLTQTTTTTVTIVDQPTLTLINSRYGSTQVVTFSLPATGLLKPSFPLACSNSVAVFVADPTGKTGSYVRQSNTTLASIGLSCSGLPTSANSANTYTFTIATPTLTGMTHRETGVYAATLGLPFLLLCGLLPRLRKSRKGFLAVLSLLLMSVALLPVTGCGGGGFVPTTVPNVASNSYLISIVDSSGKAVAEVPVVIGSF